MRVGVKQVLLRSKGNQEGERLPPGAPCGVACGQASALRSVDLTTASRLRRADTPICKEKRPKRKPFTITVLSRAHPPSYGFTLLSGKAVKTSRATSGRAFGLDVCARPDEVAHRQGRIGKIEQEREILVRQKPAVVMCEGMFDGETWLRQNGFVNSGGPTPATP